jgi:hypothetical protein
VPIHDFVGEEVCWYDARGLAAAGLSGFEPGPSAVFANPALLGFVRRPVLALSYGLRVATELRTRIVYDQFGSSMGEAAIANNIHSSGLAGPLAGAYRLGPLVGGAGIGPVRDYSYLYFKEYRDDFYIKIGEDRVVQTGNLTAGKVAVGYRPLSWFGVGAAGGYVFGRRRLEVWHISGVDTSYEKDEGAPSGAAYSGGVFLAPLARLGVGVDFRSGLAGTAWYGLPEDTSWHLAGALPWTARAALSYRVPGSLPSVVTAEAAYQAWRGADTTFSNLLVIKAGVEHTMLNFVRLRYGFGVQPMPYDPTIQRADIGFGLGFEAGFARIDVGGLLTRDLVGAQNFYRPLNVTDLKVYESRSHFAVTISREF